MNIYLRKLIWFFAVFLLPLVLSAQLPEFETVPEEPFHYEFSIVSYSSPIAWCSNPDNLTQPKRIGTNQYRITYQSKNGFIGRDTVHYRYTEFPNIRRQKAFVIEIIPSRVVAGNDFESLAADEPFIIIEVLKNDSGNRGTLQLEDYIPIANHGVANVINPTKGDIIFFPEAGFCGTASFNYVVCDDIGTCATGVVSISIECEEQPVLYETIKIFTTKNEALPIPVPFDILNVTDPDNGNTVYNGNVVSYTPDQDYHGLDEFSVTGYHSSGTMIERLVIVEVLFRSAPNTKAFDDFAYTPINQPVTINVQANDIGSDVVREFSQSPNGTVTRVGWTGQFIFTPDPGYSGRTSFTYSVGPLSKYTIDETATVYVDVGNQNPESTIFSLSTPKNVPLLINYEVPISGYSFEILNQGDFGTVYDFEGSNVYTGLGYEIEGENFIVYEPRVNYVGTDEFELNYCVNGSCTLVKVVVDVQDIQVPGNLLCADFDCIWPGDTNNDGGVDMRDLVQLGFNIGTRGVPREDKTGDWYGHFGDDWNSPYARSTVDLKYTDTNGDGVITSHDTTSISTCYGLRHNLTPEPVPFLRDLPFYAIPITKGVQPGDVMEIELHIGTPDNIAYDIYGFNFEMRYNTRNVKSSSVNIEFDPNSWVALNSPVLHLTKIPFKGKVEAGYTRTNRKSVSGYGKIGVLRFTIEDNVEGLRPGSEATVRLYFSGNNMMTGAGQNFNLPDSYIDIPVTMPAVEEDLSDDQLIVYPNPTTTDLNVHMNGQNELEQLILYNITGQQIYDSGKISLKNTNLDVSHLEAGIYLLETITAKGVITKKIKVVK